MRRHTGTDPSGHASISFHYDLAHAPTKVWRALTDPALMGEWLLPVSGPGPDAGAGTGREADTDSRFRLEPGASFTLTTQPQAGWDGVVHCRFLEIEPHRKLSYSWTVPFLDTVMTFTLEPTTTGTRLSIVQSGFEPDQKRESGGARYGWRMMSNRLIDLLARMP